MLKEDWNMERRSRLISKEAEIKICYWLAFYFNFNLTSIVINPVLTVLCVLPVLYFQEILLKIFQDPFSPCLLIQLNGKTSFVYLHLLGLLGYHCWICGLDLLTTSVTQPPSLFLLKTIISLVSTGLKLCLGQDKLSKSSLLIALNKWFTFMMLSFYTDPSRI